MVAKRIQGIVRVQLVCRSVVVAHGMKNANVEEKKIAYRFSGCKYSSFRFLLKYYASKLKLLHSTFNILPFQLNFFGFQLKV